VLPRKNFRGAVAGEFEGWGASSARRRWSADAIVMSLILGFAWRKWRSESREEARLVFNVRELLKVGTKGVGVVGGLRFISVMVKS
jgi:hypothetical protein